ncbi:MAG: glycerol-3-phosphate 1-O-acyltransferase PlsY [Victivallaceae bacterium]|nr:glycerol-3-phosphate 1-O-acyltransferase PlsY [Victivallaceae bacterium]MDD3117410.1 glycerol-3-phosphate 1-O-acyltransferase PlsY [Victivallaceae bacterium]MDD4318285.1 glycerol-3-phosphate 1-O-acyltransferase PlsY [Victivallaceae bacterium]MDD5664440.1 glycerol-3-phosphate 1-O-acyltransferase PlsY [Victivallaceae bacterium]
MSSNTILIYILIFLCSYLIGSIPWGFLIGRLYGVDIRKVGSGNIGATNVTRSLGKLPGRICFFLDLLKGFLPVLAVSMMLRRQYFDDPDQFAQIIAAASAVLGHMFSVFMKFRGGKGISTIFGVLLGFSPWSFLAAGIVWVLVFLISRYVSMASIAACAVLPVAATLFTMTEVYYHSIWVLAFLFLLSILAVIRHSANIRRLINGTENRFERKRNRTS